MDGSRPNAQNMEAAAKIYGFVVFRFDVRARCSQLKKEGGRGNRNIYIHIHVYLVSAIVISLPIVGRDLSSTSEKKLSNNFLTLFIYCIENILDRTFFLLTVLPANSIIHSKLSVLFLFKKRCINIAH